MAVKDKRLKRIWREIYEIFMNDWDPIGVKGVSEARDEYDNYIAGAYKFLMSEASEKELYDYLYHIESDMMGLSSSGLTIGKTVRKLKEIDIKKE